MNEALCSILCSEDEWLFDSDGKTIKFNKDGTGELSCRCNFSYWIFVEILWKNVKPPQDRSAFNPKGTNAAGQVLGQLDVEITLTRELPQSARRWAETHPDTAASMNRNLIDDAYKPKIFTITVVKGNFVEPCWVGDRSMDRQRYSYRLLFDKSPYSPRSEWRKPEGGPDDGRFWEIVDFVGRASPDSAKRQNPMNDPSASGWNSCIVS
ncbi:hypothetical protein F5Y16DRAFT_374802 [Xylariaceae sp. FL0255]|nr:hypothetical protein F5Y16DRAFT_374802 [Xylariaceae sp. FL0255]